MKNLISFCFLLFTFYCVHAQENDSIQIHNNILFFKDPRVDVMLKMYCRKTPGPKKGIIRVQVFQAPARDQIFEAKQQFSAHFPGIQTFVTYAPPNFRLRAGDFETQQEALKFMQTIKSLFPASFVIEEKLPDDDKNKPKKNN